MMRHQKSGHVLNISSVAGLIGFIGAAYYAATKHAVEGFSKCLALEVEPFSIHVTCIEPGPFRIDFGGRSIKMTETTIPDYADIFDKRFRDIREGSGKQAGDPARAAEAMIAITQEQSPPHHLVLGKIGIEGVTNHMARQLDEIQARREAGLATDFPPASETV